MNRTDVRARSRLARPRPAGQDRALKLWVVLSRAHAALAERAAADVARHGLTLAEFAVLEALYHKGPMLLGEVQRSILVSSGGVTYLADRLAARGLLERRACPNDRRARYAALTRAGEALIGEIFGEHAEATGILLHQLGETSADPTIAGYRRAILFYADKLDQTFE